MLIKVLKSYDMWEDDCDGWFDLYSVDDVQIYPTSDYDNTPVPDWVYEKFYETLNGSKSDWKDFILSLYYDLIISSVDACTYEEFYLENIYNIEYLESRLKAKLNVTLEIV